MGADTECTTVPWAGGAMGSGQIGARKEQAGVGAGVRQEPEFK